MASTCAYKLAYSLFYTWTVIVSGGQGVCLIGLFKLPYAGNCTLFPLFSYNDIILKATIQHNIIFKAKYFRKIRFCIYKKTLKYAYECIIKGSIHAKFFYQLLENKHKQLSNNN